MTSAEASESSGRKKENLLVPPFIGSFLRRMTRNGRTRQKFRKQEASKEKEKIVPFPPSLHVVEKFAYFPKTYSASDCFD